MKEELLEKIKELDESIRNLRSQIARQEVARQRLYDEFEVIDRRSREDAAYLGISVGNNRRDDQSSIEI